MTDGTSSLPDRIAAARPPADAIERMRLRAAMGTRLLGESRALPKLGRYAIERTLGSGAMGIVYAARDPELDREVAIKVLAPELRTGPHARDRLLREARALARLSHPNIVAVYDVGTLGDQVWIAMELVHGPTLGAWAHEQPRHWRDALPHLVGAGRALAAAHAAGLVHRDFKPDNAMIGADGRVRVLDFGLATSGVELATGVVGTRAYMAPEVLAGVPADARSDQFAYCVALGEICGGRPGPRWLQEIAERGTRPDPDDRWPDMDALVDALSRGRAIARPSRVLAIAGLVALGSAMAFASQSSAAPSDDAACLRRGDVMRDVWNEEARAAVRTGLLATEQPYAEATVATVLPTLDRHVDAWRRVHDDVCTRAEAEAWDADLRDRAQWCLDSRRLGLERLVARLSRATDRVARDAVIDVAALTPADACAETRRLARQPAPPPDRREAVRRLHASLAHGRLLQNDGRLEEALVVVDAIEAEAAALEWSPLLLDAHTFRAGLLERRGDYAGAERLDAAAYFEAAANGDWERASSAAVGVVNVLARAGDRDADARAWAKHAEAALANADDEEGVRASWYFDAMGTLARSSGDFDAAREHQRRSLAIRETQFGPDHPLLAASLNNLAVTLVDRGELAAARATHERALAIREAALGPDHPDVALVLNNLALVARREGDVEAAVELHRRALAIRERSLGETHIDVAESLQNLGVALAQIDRTAEATEAYERALAIYERRVGPDHRMVATVLDNLAALRGEAGDLEGARALQERALAIVENAAGPDHPAVARVLSNLAATLQRQGDIAGAHERFARALAIRESRLPADHPDIAFALYGLATTESSVDVKIAMLERALAIWDAAEGDQPDVPEAREALAAARAAR